MASRIDYSQNRKLYVGTAPEVTVADSNAIIAGNVGIGTTSPDGKLEIVQTSGDGTPTLIVANDASGGDGFTFQSWRYVESNTSFRLDLKQRVSSGIVQYAFDMVNNGVGYNSTLVLDRGNIGIGTTSPGAKLDVIGTGNFTGEVLFDAGFKSDSILLSGAQNFDNISRSGFYNLYNTNVAGSTGSPGFDYGTMIVVGGNKQNSSFGLQIAHERTGSGMYVRGMNDTGSTWYAWDEIWNSGNDGAGSGLDADLLDGQQGSYYVNTATAQSIAGVKSFSGKIGADGGIDGLTLANGGISGSNYNISGVNQLTIADPGEGIVFTGTATMYLNAVDDATDSILKLTNATQLNLNSTARITSLVDPSGAQDAATKNYVDTEVGNIPSGLSFEGNWNASTDTPSLAGTTPGNGIFYIVSVAGSTSLSGITDWEIGDWAVFVSNGAGTDAWQKVDNSSSLAGAGQAGRVAFWSTTSNVSFNTNFSYDGTNLTVPRLRVGDGTDGFFYSDTAGRTAFAGGTFYIQNSVPNYYNYATNIHLGATTGDNVLFRGSTITGTNWGITPAGVATFADLLTVNGDGHLFLGATGETPKIDMMYTDSASGVGYDTRIFIGKTNDLPNGGSFPTSTLANGYGFSSQANSDGVFMGIIPYPNSGGTNYRPVINWGDDVTDTPFSFQFNGADKVTVSTTGVITSLGGSSTEWNTAYDNSITTFTDSGTSTVTLTLTQQDGGTLSTSFSVPQGTVTGGPYLPIAGGTLTGALGGTGAAFTGLVTTKIYKVTSASISNSYVRVAEIDETGSQLSSSVRVTMTAHGNGHVVTCNAIISVGHSGDILIESSNLDYTQVTLKVDSNNNGLWTLSVKSTSANASNYQFDIQGLSNNLTITPLPTSSQTGTTLEHTTNFGTNVTSIGGSMSNRFGGNVYFSNVDTNNSNTSALFVNTSTFEIEKRVLGTGAFGPTPVGAYLPLAGGTMTGNLNINTSTNFPLLLTGTNTNYTAIGIRNTGSGDAGIYMDGINGDFTGSDYAFIGQKDEGYLLYDIGASSPLPYHVFTGGNVGIGTTSPGARLDVVGNGDAVLIRRSNGFASIKASSDNGGNLVLDSFSTAGAVFINHYANRPVYIATGGGNVGIGDTGPNVKLQVSTSSPTNNVAVLIGNGWVGNSSYHKEGGLLLVSGTSQNAAQTGAGIAFQTRNTQNTNYWKSSMIMDRDGAIRFTLGGAGTAAGSEDLTILSSGNVGIGVTNPGTNRLQVASTASGPAVKIDNTSSTGGSGLQVNGGNGTAFALKIGSYTGSELMRVQGNGNVGIGTNGPNTQLEIYNINDNPATLRLSSDLTDADLVGAIISFSNDAGGGGVQGRIENVSTDDDSTIFKFYTDNTSSQSMTLSETGSFQLNKYSGSSKTGTPTYMLGTDASGNVVKVLAGGGGGATDLDGLSDCLVDTASLYVGTVPSGLSGNPQNNTTLGTNAGTAITTGIKNTFLGRSTGQSTTTGSQNTFIGYEAGKLVTGNKSTYIGEGAGGGRANSYHNNTAIGYNAGKYMENADNVAIGFNAARFADGTSSRNVAIGSNAMSGAFGRKSSNIAIGYRALHSTTASQDNVAIGDNVMSAATTGASCTVMGYQAGLRITTGGQNTLLGKYAANTVTTGSNNTAIGYNAQATSATATNEITLGNSSVSTLRCAVTSITSLSDERDKSQIKDLEYGLDFIDTLKPREFVWDNRVEIKTEIDDEGNETEVEFYSANKGKKDFGFIAQEVQTVDNDTLRLVYDNNPDKIEMSYGKLVPVLVKAIQELKAEIELLKQK